MHTVNKAYTVLKQEGFVKLDRRKGAVISLNADKIRALEEIEQQLRIVLAKARCRNVTCQEIHELVDQIFLEYTGGNSDAL